MNEQAANALYEAERKGVKQIRGDYHGRRGGACGIGAIHLSLHGWSHAAATRCSRPPGHIIDAGLLTDEEITKIISLNDRADLTFAEIARKLGPDST